MSFYFIGSPCLFGFLLFYLDWCFLIGFRNVNCLEPSNWMAGLKKNSLIHKKQNLWLHLLPKGSNDQWMINEDARWTSRESAPKSPLPDSFLLLKWVQPQFCLAFWDIMNQIQRFITKQRRLQLLQTWDPSLASTWKMVAIWFTMQASLSLAVFVLSVLHAFSPSCSPFHFSLKKLRHTGATPLTHLRRGCDAPAKDQRSYAHHFTWMHAKHADSISKFQYICSFHCVSKSFWKCNRSIILKSRAFRSMERLHFFCF